MSAVKNIKTIRDSVVATVILVAGIMLASFGFANASAPAPVQVPVQIEQTAQTSLGGSTDSDALFSVNSGVGIGSTPSK